ncbi:DUF1801 domain-containing protein [Bordetella petrii]|nr:DUF1801 domain-containing protein [Bordetella petrii]
MNATRRKLPEEEGVPAAQLIDARIKELDDWRGPMLARIRDIIRRADPDVVEEWKWRVPVWSHGGIICTGEAYKQAVKTTFAKGASLPDLAGLFNSSLTGNMRRAIDFHEGDEIQEEALMALIRAAVALNLSKPAAGKPKPAASKPKLLSGGNPQIPKGEGDAPVQAYIAAMPGWKSAVGSRLDALIAQAVPGVRKAVKWNSPLYGVEDQGWFLSIHCFDKYIKVAFFRGTSLRPVPPVESKTAETRYFHIHEDEPLDEARFADWVRQASRLPGERM